MDAGAGSGGGGMIRIWQAPLLLGALAAPICVVDARAEPIHRAAQVSQSERLADLLIPREKLRALMKPAFMAGIEAEIRREQKSHSLLDRFPDLPDAIWRDVGPAMIAMVDAAYAGMRGDVVTLVSSELSEAEARTIADFLVTPTGDKLYNRSLAAGAENIASGADEETAHAKLLGDLLATMTPQDLARLEAFGSTPAARKFNGIASKIGPIGTRWGQKALEQNRERLTLMIGDAVRHFIERQPQHRA
jgi:hypothetical protein